MMKRGFIILVLLVLISSFVNAEFDANKGFTWLVSKQSNGNYGSDIQTTVFALLALKDSGANDYAQQALDYIKSQEDTSKHCFPKGGCKIKDTAFALLALKEFNDDTTNVEGYLTSSLSAALKDNWFLEVITTNNGTCKISYTKGSANEEKTINVNAGTFPDCKGSFPETFFNLNSCLESSLINKNPGIKLDINCNDLGPSTTLTVVYTSGSDIYIIDEAASSRYEATIENGCFGTTAGSSCSKDTTLFANWILSKAGSDVSTELWIKNNYDDLNAIDLVLFYLAAKDSNMKTKLAEKLKSVQRNDGSFNKNVYDTALAVLALKEAQLQTEADNAVNWLKSKQSNDGSWDGKALSTASALYAAFSGAGITLPPIGTGGTGPGPGDSTGFCGDGSCDPDENSFGCEQDCGPSKQPSDICVENDVCEYGVGENSDNCQQDCYCGDGVCDDAESSSECSQDCGGTGEPTPDTAVCGNGIIEGMEQCDMDPSTGIGDDTLCPGKCAAPGEANECSCEAKKGGSALIWIILAAIIILGLGGFLFLKFRGAGGGAKRAPITGEFSFPTSKPPYEYQPSRRPSQGTSFKTKIEDDLDKSIEEAKKLLKKI